MHWINRDVYLYHGTNEDSATNILQIGVKLFKGPAAKDFGQGFYTTTNLEQAKHWASIRSRARHGSAILEYRLPRHLFDNFSTLFFLRKGEDTGDNGYWDFVRHCRSDRDASHMRGNDQSQYDVVMGPVAKRWDQLPLSIHDGYDQISFHTERAVGILNTFVPTRI